MGERAVIRAPVAPRPWLLVALVCVACLAGRAQGQPLLGLSVPEGSALTLSADTVVFDLRDAAYPPAAFPAWYAPSRPTAPVTLDLFTNIESSWLVVAGFEGLLREDGTALPADRIEFRVDGGPWVPFGRSTTLATGRGATPGYLHYDLEFRLRLEGDERPGVYQGVLLFSLVEP